MALKWKLWVWIEQSQIHTYMNAAIGGNNAAVV